MNFCKDKEIKFGNAAMYIMEISKIVKKMEKEYTDLLTNPYSMVNS